MPSPEQRRSILITGSSSGVGKALALHFVSAGWLVFATVRKASDAQALRKDAAQAGAAKPGSVSPGVLQPVLMDVTDEASVQKAMQEVEATCGERGLNVLVNNAGEVPLAHIHTYAHTRTQTRKHKADTDAHNVYAGERPATYAQARTVCVCVCVCRSGCVRPT